VSSLHLPLGILISLFGDPVPDGLIHRGIQVVARPNGIDVRYQLGLSDSMVRDELQRMTTEGAQVPAGAAEALMQYRDVVNKKLPERMTARIDGNAVELKPLRADLIRQHHMQIECAYRIEFTVGDQPSRLELRDDNFPDMPGDHRIAMKARGQVRILQSNQGQLLTRDGPPSALGNAWTAPPKALRRLEAVFCRGTGDTQKTDAADSACPIDVSKPPLPGTGAGVEEANAPGTPPATAPGEDSRSVAGGDSSTAAADVSPGHDLATFAMLLIASLIAVAVVLLFVPPRKAGPKAPA
jgi:hypothetical protein